MPAAGREASVSAFPLRGSVPAKIGRTGSPGNSPYLIFPVAAPIPEEVLYAFLCRKPAAIFRFQSFLLFYAPGKPAVLILMVIIGLSQKLLFAEHGHAFTVKLEQPLFFGSGCFSKAAALLLVIQMPQLVGGQGKQFFFFAPAELPDLFPCPEARRAFRSAYLPSLPRCTGPNTTAPPLPVLAQKPAESRRQFFRYPLKTEVDLPEPLAVFNASCKTGRTCFSKS